MSSKDSTAQYRRLQRRYDITLTAASIIAVLICATFAFAPAAKASEAPRAAAERDVREMTRVGVDYWADRGLTSCPGFQFEFADDFPEGAYGQAPVGECHGWLDRSAFGYRTRSRHTLMMRCTIVVHEIGHGNGLEHVEDGGIMDPSYSTPPRECREWARAKVAAASVVRRGLAAHMARGDGGLR